MYLEGRLLAYQVWGPMLNLQHMFVPMHVHTLKYTHTHTSLINLDQKLEVDLVY